MEVNQSPPFITSRPDENVSVTGTKTRRASAVVYLSAIYFTLAVLFPPDGLIGLFERSNISLTIADFTQPDCPLVGANAAFLELSGYDANAVIGHNCRFLQPEGGAGPVRARMRRFLKQADELDGKFLIPNVTKQGEPFLNLVYMAKLQRDGETKLVLGSQFRCNLAM